MVPALALFLAGCEGLPISGSRAGDVLGGAGVQLANAPQPGAPRVGYALVTLDPAVMGTLAAQEQRSAFDAALSEAGPGEVLLGPGDIVSITIFEAQAGGLFIPAEAGSRPGNFVNLPAQQVARDGTVSVPFAGSVRAAGRTTAQLEADIRRRLETRALDPQVLVTLNDRRSAVIAVVGEVNQSLRFPLDPGGERLLGAIARAGGPRFPPHETVVQLQRGGAVAQALLADITDDPRQNVQLRAGDVVVITREQRYFLAFGAVGQTATVGQLNRRLAFEERRLTLADAIARAGGLQDDRANPAAVFLYRFEQSTTLARAGLAVDAVPGGTVPTVYRVDLADPSGLFLAQQFAMRADDVLFVSNAPATDIEKFLQIVLPLAQTGANIRVTTR
jgi:polysaccharide export outer membrane protein